MAPTPSLSFPLIVLVEAMSPKLPFLFSKGHGAKKHQKSRTKKDGVVASPIESATTSTSIKGTSVTGGESSQRTLTNVGFQVTVQQPATTVSAEPPTPTDSPAPTATSDAVASNPPSLPERLWDRAYDELKAKESKLVATYEKILSRELKKKVIRVL